MKTPHQKIEDYIAVEGWDIEEVLSTDLEWWADEIWKLKSRWLPEGKTAFITFLVDSMHEGNRKKGRSVWGIGNCADFPNTLEDAQSNGCISLKSGIKNDIEEFIGIRGAILLNA